MMHCGYRSMRNQARGYSKRKIRICDKLTAIPLEQMGIYNMVFGQRHSMNVVYI